MVLLIDYLKIQTKLGFSPIVLFTGRQRMGKTAMAMRIAYELDPTWDPKTCMTFRIEEFVEAYDKYSDKVLILDEAGVPLDPYEHFSITQRVYKHIIQTQAYKRNTVFLVLPFASEIGRAHCKHVTAIVEVVWRGVYVLYRTKSWHSDLSQKPPRLEKIEIVSHVPLPPPHIWEWYSSQGQTEYKESIMGMQKAVLEVRRKRMSATGGETKTEYTRLSPETIAKIQAGSY